MAVNLAMVIPVYNRKEVTIGGLQNIYDSLEYYHSFGKSTLQIDVIVVDDGSTDGTSEYIGAQYKDVTVLKGDGNLWWSGAINMGAKYASSLGRFTHVLLWNDDTICKLDYFVILENTVNQSEEYLNSILVSKVFWINNKNILFNFGCYYDSKTGKQDLIGLNKPDTFNEIKRVDWSGGMGTLIPIHILQKVNFFDNINFPQYHGDIDFFLRVKENGFHTYAIPKLIIYNNAETTGIVKATNFKQLGTVFTSNSSLHNFKQNYYFNKRHSNTFVSWLRFVKRYSGVVLKSII